ncbi:MAG TPA: CDP-diacylglycerol--serine O-phosphatidyltransferase, partial [Planctomycetes bacterium]|nr:CDP-diacylglycerol--serine O-phosphatidyltransferase [Planctomycetota bacterium]
MAKKIRRVAIIPTLLTLGNLLSGFAAITRAFSAMGPGGAIDLDRLSQAAMLCLVAMVFDVLDGSVARLTHTTSRFGAELDSLAD